MDDDQVISTDDYRFEFNGKVKNGIVIKDESEAKLYIETALKAWKKRESSI